MRRRKTSAELTKLFAHFHASLILENALAPIRVAPEGETDDGSSDGRDRPVDLIGQYDEQSQESIVRDSSERLILLAAEMETKGRAVSPDDAKRAIKDVLTEHGIVENQDALARQIVLMLRRQQTFDLPVEDLVAAAH